MRVFDCFLDSGESFMLYVRLVNLARDVDCFVVGWSALSFSGREILNVSLAPFENEIRTFKGELRFIHIDILSGELSSGFRDCREKGGKSPQFIDFGSEWPFSSGSRFDHAQ
jgi:hypothetical protein